MTNDFFLNLHSLPSPFPEEVPGCQGQRRFCGYNGNGNAINFQVEHNGQQIGEWYFEQPKAEEVDSGWCNRVATAIKGLSHDHSHGI